MREQFPWFFDPTEEELQRLWDEATFCFDANVLLNLYRVDRETTQDYFKIFRALGDRIFLPHEAANQFFHNRRGVIRTEQNSFSKAKDEVEKWKEERLGFGAINSMLGGDSVGNIIEAEIETVFEDREDYEREVEAVKNDLIDRIEDLEERFTPTGTTRANAEEDEILEGLMDVFEGKTGSELDEDIDELKKEAQSRYEAEKPPGYEDYNGEDKVSRGECEDFLIWKQLMDFAEREGEDVVFITGEEKYDWWEKDYEHNFVRPGHELLREFKRETGQDFWMFATERLIEGANEKLGLDVKDKSVEQTGKIAGRYTEGGVGKDEVERAWELWKLAESIEEKAKEAVEMETLAAGGAIGAAQATLSIEGNKIINLMMEALELSEELRSPSTENTIKEHIRKLSHATATGSEEATVSYLENLATYLETVAETLRREAKELADVEASFVS
ncbi:PIN-like domain-containing protein [Salinibacter ruber]|uniref:Nucleic acid-binding protein n=1 Tax=Salinibacter ruber TaxID=146919 RepID=A0A9X2U3T2_9BACT|nr:PIN-like domain-containing protein [Salinibacter ruber]MCS3822657.1 putative nucleic acid-binding protein [Salinibacter ruber]MCS3859460.1 putative nucleic acid-binding protein [Salinibacter ruber]MCS3866340.1 putative nucleic acid-binding protein [Salinibacter ruber]